jgi:hypothetical protein
MMSEARAREQRVLRCDCGQFIRLDRDLSEPPLAPEEAQASAGTELSDSFDDEETRMFASLEDLAAQLPGGAMLLAEAPKLGVATLPDAPSGPPDFADEDENEATRVVTAPSSLLRSLPAKANGASSPAHSSPAHSSPARSGPGASPAPTQSNEDRPLWYVDLGGKETLEMTIEQLIGARRSGRLGEGALVWRAGMTRWRPIGTLIPAAGSGAPARPLPPPNPPSKPLRSQPLTSKPAQAAPPEPAGLGSYRRPLATLEFALDEKDPSGASAKAGPPPPPAPLPHPSAPPPPRRAASTPAPPNKPSPTDAAPVSSVSGQVTAIEGSGAHNPFGRRYPPVAIAVGISIVASAMGALLVRALRSTPAPVTATLSAAAAAAPNSGAPNMAPKPPAPAAASAAPEPTTQVVDIDSLSVEKKPAPRVAVPMAPVQRAAQPAETPTPSPAPDSPAPSPRAAAPTSNALKRAMAGELDTSPASDDSEPSPVPAPKPKSKPDAAKVRPTSDSATDSSASKTKPGRDDPGF